MTNIINASHWKHQADAVGKLAQYYSGQLLGLMSFAEASKPETWRHRQAAFAGVWVNQVNHEIIMVRDHFGLQPLYYYYHSGQFIFADNIPNILKQLPKTPGLNTDQLVELFSGYQFYNDETFYKGIYRVEPGTITCIKSDGSVHKKIFWKLDPAVNSIDYKNDHEYLEHFSELMNQSIQFNTQDKNAIAAEFSGGLDSTAVCAAAYQQGLRIPLLMHEAPIGSINEDYDKSGEEAFTRRFEIKHIHRVNAENFDPIPLMQQQAELFAGACPYIFTLLANNVHQVVVDQGYKVLLSGFGGDQGVSGHAFNRAYLPELLHQRKYRQAMNELIAESSFKNQAPPREIRRVMQLLKFSNPIAYRCMQQVESIEQAIKHFVKRTSSEKSPLAKPPYYRHLREFEWDHLQGPRSHEIRMRIEYSAIWAKQLGFQYRYPLLYPPLIEFYFRLPSSQKRRDGVGRYIMRRYLDQYFPEGEFSRNQKTQGLHIMPATRDKCEKLRDSGFFDECFRELPFQQYLKLAPNDWSMLMNQMYAYMFKCFNIHE